MTAFQNRKLWVVSELYRPEDTSTGYFLTTIAEGVADRFDVNILCGRPTYAWRGQAVPRREHVAKTHIRRLWSTAFRKDNILGRTINLISFTVSVFIHACLRFRKGDLVLVVTNPPTVPPVVLVAGRLRGCRLLLLIHDVYPDVLFVTGAVRDHGFVGSTLRRFFNAFTRRFDHIIVLGRDMSAIIQQKLNAAEPPITIIPNWGDANIGTLGATEANRYRQDLGLEGQCVFQFSGNIGRTHDVEAILDAMAALADDAAITALFIGDGGKATLVRGAAGENIRYLPRQHKDRLGEMLKASDATIIAFRPGMAGISVPSRMYNVMAAGVPIIALADTESELARVVDETGCGWVCNHRENLASLMRTIAANPEDRRRRGELGRQALLANYTFDQILPQWKRVLDSLSSLPASAQSANDPLQN